MSGFSRTSGGPPEGGHHSKPESALAGALGSGKPQGDLDLVHVQALQSTTTRAAALLRREADLGQIAPGFVADLVAVPGNPLEDVTVLERPLFVTKDGRVHKRP